MRIYNNADYIQMIRNYGFMGCSSAYKIERLPTLLGDVGYLKAYLRPTAVNFSCIKRCKQ